MPSFSVWVTCLYIFSNMLQRKSKTEILVEGSLGNILVLSYMQGFPPLTNLTEFSSLNVSTPIVATRESKHVRLKSVSMCGNS